MTVTEIYVKLRLEQSVASQHLAILRRAGIVVTQRDGKFIYYAVNYDRIAEVNQFVEDLAGYSNMCNRKKISAAFAQFTSCTKLKANQNTGIKK